jgi:aldehyde dehydrogenase (NAD+)
VSATLQKGVGVLPIATSPTSASGPITYPSQLLIDGRLVSGDSDPIEVENPATAQPVASLATASSDQVDLAVMAARRAFDAGVWRDPSKRRECLLTLADLMDEHRVDLTQLVITEVGTPITLCETLQVAEPISMLRYFADRAVVDRTRHLGVSQQEPRSDAVVRYEPTGVVAAVTAYNYPLLFAAVKLGAALAAGCTAVLLPSYQTPMATLFLGELCLKAGFPDGVVNFLVGGVDTARALTSHSGVDKISFTGSTDVGRKIMAQAAPHLTRLVLELGGKSASILLPDVDLTSITTAVHARYLRNAGQGCSSPTRIFVHRPKYDEFVELSKAAVTGIQVGDPWDPKSVAGPLISASHRDRVENYVERAIRNDGGRLIAGGGRPDITHGWYMNPAVLSGLSNTSELARNELFGPVGVVFAYDSIDEAVALANQSDYGLSATIYGDQAMARDLAPRLRVGTVMINGWVGRRDHVSGGFKNSGMGRESGEDGVREFLETQYVAWPVG